jgi:type III pantothenate kinase
MKNLVIDAGNSRVKLFVFEGDIILESFVSDENDLEKKINKIFSEHEILEIIVSSVGSLTDKILFLLKNIDRIIVLSNETKVPFLNRYLTPRTLGVDRIALVSAAVIQYPLENVLVIDAGTCITFDFKNSKEEYLGGAISPGLEMRYKALSLFTEKLPLLEKNEQNPLVGIDTNSSIHSGVINGLISEITGVIERYKSEFGDLTIVLTGGDTYFLSKRLKNSIFANPNFLQEGLNSILIYNT